jgi:putative phosphoribosyl transferase
VDAGRHLTVRLRRHAGQDVVVLGVPRGGIPVAAEVARALRAPLDVIAVRKLGAPLRPELVIGAIGEGGVCSTNPGKVSLAGMTADDLAEAKRQGRAAFDRTQRVYHDADRRLSLRWRTAVVVDDGIATGATARVACDVARARGAATVVLAVPVAPQDALVELGDHADEIVCLETPAPFFFVARWYANFTRVLDDEALDLLRQADAHAVSHRAAGRHSAA